MLISWVTVTKADEIVVPNVIIPQGGSATLEIQLNNEQSLRKPFQFLLKLPEGVTMVAHSQIPGNRIKDAGMDIYDNEVEERQYQFICFAGTDDSPIPGNSGTLFTIVVVADDVLQEGTTLSGSIEDIEFDKLDRTNAGLPTVCGFTITIGKPDDGRVLLDEDSTTPPAAAADVNVTVKRTINANEWSTICLPFAMTEEQMKECFGNDVKLADFTSWTSEVEGRNVVGINVYFETVTAIKANHPYIIKVSAPITEFTVDGVNIEPVAEPVVQVGATAKARGWFHGTYAVMKVPEENLFLSGNKFWYSTGATTIKGYHGYFELHDVLDVYYDDYDGSEVKVSLFVNGADGIGSIVEEHLANDNAAYNLAGQRVGKSYKGIVVERGKKTIK